MLQQSHGHTNSSLSTMNRRRSSLGVLNFDALPDPGPRFQLGERLGAGVNADVYEAQDLQQAGRAVAIKIQKITEETMEDLEEEYNVLKKLSEHHNLPDFYGAYRKRSRDADQLWFVMELCKGGSVADLVRSLDKEGRKLSELHIAFILKEVIKAVLHLHENHVMHRDIRGANILLTAGGEIRLVDFGLSRELKATMGKRGTSVGSPSWMAPEVVTSENKSSGQEVYDNRIDVWALGITAIELADCKAPYEGIHPTRALFQIVRNPPPTLRRPASWSQIFNDFISECLEKNPDNRPYMMEMVEHPFFEKLPENDLHIPHELKAIMSSIKARPERFPEMFVRTNFLKRDQNSEPELMLLEDMAANETISEDLILDQLHQRMRRGNAYTFLGDVLLFLNPNETQDIYTDEIRRKYMCKSRSDNVPHIFAVADCAYQDVLHHEEPQHIILSGESHSGKTTNMMHLLRQLLWIGKGNMAVEARILSSMTILHALGNACTPINGNSTRHVLHTHVTFTTTGRVSGAIFWLYQLERWRITTDDRRQGNFHLFYYFYDAMVARKELEKYNLESGRRHRYLRSVTAPSGGAPANTVASDPSATANNKRSFENFEAALRNLEFGDEGIQTIKNMLAAILVLGELRFRDGGDGKAEIENPRVASSVASLLNVDEKKLSWAMVNYCVVECGQAEKRRQSPEEAEEARDAFARALYNRLADWIVNSINLKLSFTRAVFGDRHMVSILDLFGFECFQRNNLDQLIVNSLNEQLQYHYSQRLFAWEMQEREEEEVTNVAERLTFYNNRPTVDLLMAKPDGIMWLVDEATRKQQGAPFIVESLRKVKSTFCQTSANDNEFSVAHYTGKVTYDARDFYDKNRDFVPPEVTETMRLSNNATIKEIFTNPLTRTGNLTQSKLDVSAAEAAVPSSGEGRPRRTSKWSAAILSDKQRHANRGYNTVSRGHFSQTRRMRTTTATFRAVCLELLRSLNNGGTHFVRCVRAELTGQPRGFQPEVVRQQVRALGVLDTVRARQGGFPCRVPFSEFLRRYKFLAFDFDETVDETGDNCRLLMVRLKMEGYAMGKTKVFLKYYNEEFLARLYEVQVKKIVKVQAMMRSFLAKRRVEQAGPRKPGALAGLGSSKDEDKKKKGSKAPEKKVPKAPVKKASELEREEAALIIQKQYRGYQARKEYGPKMKSKEGFKDYDAVTSKMMRMYYQRWRARSVFQVLLLYRAARQQDLVYFSQQIHMYNQAVVNDLQSTERKHVTLEKVRRMDRKEAGRVLGNRPANVWKLPFRFDRIPYFDTSPMCDPVEAGFDALYTDNLRPGDHDTWDAPLRRKKSIQMMMERRNMKFKDQEVQTGDNPTPREVKSVGTEMEQNPALSKHTQVPFRRELLDNMPPVMVVNRKKAAPRRPGELDVPSSHSSAVASPSPTHSESRRPGSLKKSPAPKPPSAMKSPASPMYQQQSWMDKQQSWMDKQQGMNNRSPVRRGDLDNNNDFDFPRENNARAYNGGRNVGVRPNSHIRELEMRGKEINNAAVDEDAPFNFQAMLRKTNYNRSSMKRNSIYTTDDVDGSTTAASPRGNFNISTYDDSNYGGARGYQNYGGERRQQQQQPWESSANQSPQVGGGAIRKGPTSYSAAVKQGNYKNDYNDSASWSSKQSNEEKRFELAPGFVVEGDATDL